MTTRKDITGMTDEQLKEAVAAEVMGWQVNESPDPLAPKGSGRMRKLCWRGEACFRFDAWNPLTDWNHTMEVVKRMHTLIDVHNDHWDFVLDWTGEEVVAVFGSTHVSPMYVVGKMPAQRAICLAALLAVRSFPTP